MKNRWNWIKLISDWFDDRDDADEPGYDPVDIAAAIVYFLFGIGVLYWDLWCIYMYKGGLLSKIIPFLTVVFTGRTLADFGYEGWPYELGIFDGWIVNVIALIFLLYIIGLVVWVERRTRKQAR